jgi:hypothetical protein
MAVKELQRLSVQDVSNVRAFDLRSREPHISYDLFRSSDSTAIGYTACNVPDAPFFPAPRWLRLSHSCHECFVYRGYSTTKRVIFGSSSTPKFMILRNSLRCILAVTLYCWTTKSVRVCFWPILFLAPNKYIHKLVLRRE